MFNADAVKRWLDANERTAAWLARKADLAQGTISQALSGVRSPSIETVAAIARATGMRPNDLITVEVAS